MTTTPQFGLEGIKSGCNSAPVVIENSCWIGAGVNILRGTHIGEGCEIGTGGIFHPILGSHPTGA